MSVPNPALCTAQVVAEEPTEPPCLGSNDSLSACSAVLEGDTLCLREGFLIRNLCCKNIFERHERLLPPRSA